MALTSAITIRLEPALLERLDAYRERMSRETGFDLSRADAARKLIADGIAASAPQKKRRPGG